MPIAPLDPPPSLLGAYTLGNQVPYARLYVDEGHVGDTVRITVSRGDRRLRRGGMALSLPHRPPPNDERFSCRGRDCPHWRGAVEDKDVVVFERPSLGWSASASLQERRRADGRVRSSVNHRGCRPSRCPRLKPPCVAGSRRARVAVALSSFDHDGLGRLENAFIHTVTCWVSGQHGGRCDTLPAACYLARWWARPRGLELAPPVRRAEASPLAARLGRANSHRMGCRTLDCGSGSPATL